MIDKKLVAWGAGPSLELYLRHTSDHRISYCVDTNPELQGTELLDVPIVSPAHLAKENKDETFVIITAMSSASLKAIHTTLSDHGYSLGKHYIDLSAFLKNTFQVKAESVFGLNFSDENYAFARSFNFNSQTPLETTILGNWLLLEALQATRKLEGAIAEVGAYKGGNCFLLLSAMTLWKDKRYYYVLDSFEGFGDFSIHDPKSFQKAYNYDYQANLIFNSLSLFQQAIIIPGFVPHTFPQIPHDQRFSVVFYDCDLYQPALDTYAFFWDRIEDGGMLIIHDNIATENGWAGVRKATEEFFNPKGIRFFDLWETTMSVILK